MAVTVNLYTLSKVRNSTKRPSASSGSYSCVLKEGTDVWNPTFILTGDPHNCNYCSAFGNYYYVDRIDYVPPHWHLTCTLDSMATWKNQIGNASLYVTRANSTTQWDKRLIDNLPVRVGPSAYFTTPTPTPFNLSNASYVVSIAAGTGSTGCDHIVFTPLQYRTFLYRFLDVGLWDFPSAWTDTEKSQINPIEYIKDVRWYPFRPATVQDAESPVEIYVNGWNTHAVGCAMVDGYVENIISGLTVPRHPQASTYGSFLNGSPYARYTWVDPFFGTIPIDASLLTMYNTLTYNMDIDPASGFGHLRLMATEVDHNSFIIADRTAEFGVPVLFSQETHGGIQGIASDVQSALGNLVTGNLASFIGSFLNITSDFGSTKLATTGSVGSKAMYYYTQALYSEFYEVIPLQPSTQGYPVCKTLTINTLSGFVQVAKGDVPVPGPSWAAAEIKSYLEGGFYYE